MVLVTWTVIKQTCSKVYNIRLGRCLLALFVLVRIKITLVCKLHMSKAKGKKWTNIFLNSNEAKCTESMLVNVYRWGFNKVRDNQQATHKSGEFTHTSFDGAHLSKSLNLPSTIAGTCPIGFISEERSSNQRKSSRSANTSQMSFMNFPPLVVKEHMYIHV